MKNKTNFKLIILILLSLALSLNTRLTKVLHINQPLFAEEEEEEEEEERKEEEDKEDEDEEDHEDRNQEDEDQYYEEVVYETIIVPQEDETLLENIVRYITIVDPGFNIDTDKDLLVDALDPNPLTPEWEFFTDDDKDTIPNAIDKYKGEDDFSYVEFSDINNNGILDDFENTQ